MRTIRPVRPDEYDRVGNIVLAAYDAVGTMSDDYRTELRATARRIDDDTSVLVAVEDGGRPLGTITLANRCSRHFEHPRHGDGGFRALAVDPGAQGAGAGRALVEHVVAHGRRAGWRRVAITTMEWMHAAQTLYERLGFVRRVDLDVTYPAGVGHGYVQDLTRDAAEFFPTPGPAPASPPWYEDLPNDRTPCA